MTVLAAATTLSVGTALALALGLGAIVTVCLLRLARPTLGGTNDMVALLRTGFGAAWPMYWLVAYLLVDAAVAWPALIAAIATMSLLPAIVVGMATPTAGLWRPSVVPAVFFLLTCALLLVAGVGFDRTFSAIDGHFLFTILLLALWWGWYDRRRTNCFFEPGPTLRPRAVWSAVIGVVVYHVAAIALLMTTKAVASQWNVSAGILFGLVFAGCWLPAAVKDLRGCGNPANVLLARSLAALYLMAVVVVAAGSAAAVLAMYEIALPGWVGPAVGYPLTVWQMEGGLLLMTAVYWLGRSQIDAAPTRAEHGLLAVVYLAYLILRVWRLWM